MARDGISGLAPQIERSQRRWSFASAATVWTAASALWLLASLKLFAMVAPGAAADLVRSAALRQDCAAFEQSLKLTPEDARLCRTSPVAHVVMARAHETARAREHALTLRLFQLSTHADLASGVGFDRIKGGSGGDLLSPRLALVDRDGALRLEISGVVDGGQDVAAVAYAVPEALRDRLAEVVVACDAGVCGRFAETAVSGARAPVFLPRPLGEPVRAAMAPHVARLDRLDARLATLGLR